MKCYLAPMEGITNHIYRNAHSSVFSGIDKYFAPFITPNNSKRFNTRELRDLLPQNNLIKPIPQILTNDAQGFIETAEKLAQLGYIQVNLNMGCPSNTVVSKGRGSGFLEFPHKIDRFLDKVFSAVSVEVSIKTRTGRYDDEEFYSLMDIFNQYPIAELIVHPRTREQFYKDSPNMKMFEYALEKSRCCVCYNGDIFNDESYDKFTEKFPNEDRIMIGRGIIANPSFMSSEKDKKSVEKFHKLLYEGYKEEYYTPRAVLSKMKEVWHYMADSEWGRKIKICGTLEEYDKTVKSFFDCEDVILGSLFK